jgi:hypothetical protein
VGHEFAAKRTLGLLDTGLSHSPDIRIARRRIRALVQLTTERTAGKVTDVFNFSLPTVRGVFAAWALEGFGQYPR